MKLLRTKLYYKRSHWQIIERGYLDKTDIYWQSITKVWWFLFIPYHMELLLSEQIPNYVIIQIGCHGYTDWKSSNPKLIDEYLKQKK